MTREGRTAVAVVGLGAMGGVAAARLAAAGFDVTGVDPSPAAAERARGHGFAVAGSVTDAVGSAGAVLLSLPAPRHVAAVVAELVPAVRPGTLVVDLSTIDPDTASGAAETLRPAGCGYVDAPVLGRPERVGAWTCVVGGDEAAFAAARDLLHPTLAARVLHVGPAGSASTVKVLNNLMLGAINAITVEALTLAEAAGLDPGVFVDAVAESGAASVSGLFRDIAPRIVAGDFTPTFAVELLHKDNQLAMDVADRVGMPLVVGRAVQLLNTMALRAGVGAEDSGAVVRVYEHLMGVTVRRHGAQGQG